MSADEYAFWAPRCCAVACVSSALGALGIGCSPIGELRRELCAAGVYRLQGGRVIGALFHPLVAWLEAKGVQARVDTSYSTASLLADLRCSAMVMLNVDRSISGHSGRPPRGRSTGGHFILVHDLRGQVAVVFHDPAGVKAEWRANRDMLLAELDLYSSKRAIVINSLV